MVLIVKSESQQSTVEVWETRFGPSVRVVERTRKGKFLNHKSAKQVSRLQAKVSSSAV